MLQLLIQTVQQQIRQQGRPGTPLRRPFPRRLQALVRQRPGLQVAVDELSHPSIRHPLFHQAHQLIVVDPVEELLEVQVHHPAVARPSYRWACAIAWWADRPGRNP